MIRRALASAVLVALAFCSGCSASQSNPVASPGVSGGPVSSGGPELQTDEVLQSYLDPHRDEFQRPDEVIKRLGLREGQVVADIGSGSGYFTWHFSRAVGASGKVLAVDTDPHAIDFLKRRLKREPPPHPNIESIQSTYDDTGLAPGSVDVGFLCEAHFMVENDVRGIACMQTLRRALKPGGRVAIIEAKEDPRRGKVPLELLTKSLKSAGFTVDSVQDMYEREHFVIFK